MSELVLLGRAEKIAIRFDLAQDEVVDLLEGDYVYSDRPHAAPAGTFVMVARIGSQVLPGPYRVERSIIQHTVIGGPRAMAWRVGETLRAAYAQRFEGLMYDDLNEFVPTGLPSVGGMREGSDESFKSPRPTASFDVVISLRPTGNPVS